MGEILKPQCLCENIIRLYIDTLINENLGFCVSLLEDLDRLCSYL